MSKIGPTETAFEMGRKAGHDQRHPIDTNPFVVGSAEHNNFEVGHRFGAQTTAKNEDMREKPHVISPDEAS